MDVPASSPSSSACPPPLVWHEVLTSVERQGRPFIHLGPKLSLQGLVLGNGPPLWFLNGLTGDRRQFALCAWLLRDRYQCVLADINWEKPPRSRDLVPAFTDTLIDAFETLQHHRPALFGAGVGAQLALATAARIPDSLRGLILQTGQARRRPGIGERLLARLAAFTNRPLSSLSAWVKLQEHNHRLWFPSIDPSRWEFLLSVLGETSTRRWSVLARAAAACDLTNRLESITTPTFLLRTEGDGSFARRNADELLARLPDVREETLHSAGHYAFLTQPHRVSKIIDHFLTGLADETGTRHSA